MRLVDLDEIKTPIPNEESDFSEILEYIKELNNLDSVKVTFCKNCRKCVEQGGYAHYMGYLYCKRKGSLVDEYDFCSWGEDR